MSKVIREDLVVPYKHSPTSSRSDASAMISQSLPMAAMFMRNKLLSWTSFFLSVQSYLNEPNVKAASESDNSQPPLLRILFSLISLGTCYMDILFPAVAPGKKGVSQAIKDATSSIASAPTGK